MNIGVGIFPEQVDVRFQRIVNFNLGRGSVARKGVILAARVFKGYAEVVDAIEDAADGWAARWRYRHSDLALGRCCPASPAAARLEPFRLQCERIISAADAFKVTGSGMAAFASRVEINLAFFRVPC